MDPEPIFFGFTQGSHTPCSLFFAILVSRNSPVAFNEAYCVSAKASLVGKSENPPDPEPGGSWRWIAALIRSPQNI